MHCHREHSTAFARKSILATAMLLFLGTGIFAQQTLMDYQLRQHTRKDDYGMNLKHFLHLYGGLGMMAGPSDGAGGDIAYGMSMNPTIGGRYKMKVSRHHAFIFDVNYDLYSFKIRQTGEKILPDTVRHNAERFLFSSVGIGVYHRVSLGRIGNYIGKFFDFGVYGDWIHYTDHYFKDRADDGLVFRSHVSGLTYINTLQYGAGIRFGITRYAFYAKYRLSDYFFPSKQYPELPRFTFGVQVGLHKVN